jgi:hypothetical protein
MACGPWQRSLRRSAHKARDGRTRRGTDGGARVRQTATLGRDERRRARPAVAAQGLGKVGEGREGFKRCFTAQEH